MLQNCSFFRSIKFNLENVSLRYWFFFFYVFNDLFQTSLKITFEKYICLGYLACPNSHMENFTLFFSLLCKFNQIYFHSCKKIGVNRETKTSSQHLCIASLNLNMGSSFSHFISVCNRDTENKNNFTTLDTWLKCDGCCTHSPVNCSM